MEVGQSLIGLVSTAEGPVCDRAFSFIEGCDYVWNTIG